jgi:hypothetical protein
MYYCLVFIDQMAPSNVTQNQQIKNFLIKFSDLLQNIQSKKLESYIFIDSNLDLLNLRQQNAENYLNIILEKSFLQRISKATRIQNNSKSLIDHILFNSNGTDFLSGTIVSDLSDHFFMFIARLLSVKISCLNTGPLQLATILFRI